MPNKPLAYPLAIVYNPAEVRVLRNSSRIAQAVGWKTQELSGIPQTAAYVMDQLTKRNPIHDRLGIKKLGVAITYIDNNASESVVNFMEAAHDHDIALALLTPDGEGSYINTETDIVIPANANTAMKSIAPMVRDFLANLASGYELQA